jgi:hypothetical protein
MKTVAGDGVWMTMQETPSRAEDLGALGYWLARQSRPASTNEFEGLLFPMVDLAMSTDLSWLVGLGTVDRHGRACEVARAEQQNTLRMNETGFRAKSATSITTTLSSVRRHPPHVIDRPFLFWIERPTLSRPLFAAWLTEDCWRRPPDVETP